MLSRNKERVGGTKQPNAAPPPQQLTQGQGTDAGHFSFVVPTEFVELPSQGKYYTEEHPLHNQESIEIRQMTAKEEDILTSRTLLKKGVALDRVIQNLIVDKRINPDTLLVGDRNAIIVATRVTGYGNLYATQIGCPNCGITQEYEFDLNEADIYTAENLNDHDIVNNHDGTFDTILPRTQVTVTFRLLRGIDEKQLVSDLQAERKRKGHERNITKQLANILVAVNGDDTPAALQYFVENVPSIDSRHLRTAYSLATPNIDLTQTFACGECDHEADMEVPLSADFFWPDR
ncbi:MAG TPA: hypothetical protein EYM96_12060 [Rhodospirillales bacterium]|nr:hypothetical protein [Rhodospirillales bacterium]